jgi:hypothetical protein
MGKHAYENMQTIYCIIITSLPKMLNIINKFKSYINPLIATSDAPKIIQRDFKNVGGETRNEHNSF